MTPRILHTLSFKFSSNDSSNCSILPNPKRWRGYRRKTTIRSLLFSWSNRQKETHPNLPSSPPCPPPLNTSNSPENLQFRQKNTGRTDCSPIPTFLEPLRVEIVLPTEGSLSLSYKIIRPNTCPCWRRNGASTEPNFFSRNLKGEGGAIKPADAFERNVTGLRPFSSFLGPRNGPPIPRRSLTTGRFSTNRAGWRDLGLIIPLLFLPLERFKG